MRWIARLFTGLPFAVWDDDLKTLTVLANLETRRAHATRKLIRFVVARLGPLGIAVPPRTGWFDDQLGDGRSSDTMRVKPVANTSDFEIHLVAGAN